ncbi:hypothetical protein ACWEN4_36300 [Streptomyces violaceorubidus]
MGVGGVDPLADDSADAATALLTVHHRSEPEAGVGALMRITRQRVVVLTFGPGIDHRFWLPAEYLPEAAAFDGTRAVTVERLAGLLGGARVEAVPVPHDRADGLLAAFWRRPGAYLDPAVRAGTPLFAQTGDEVLRPCLARLSDDLSSGRWHRRRAGLLGRTSLDAGHRLLMADL